MPYEFTEWEQEPEPQASFSRSGSPPRKHAGIGFVDPPEPPKKQPAMLYLKCVVAGLMTLILVFGLYFLASVVPVEMIGFTIGFASPVLWLVFSLAVFGAGFLWELRRSTK